MVDIATVAAQERGTIPGADTAGESLLTRRWWLPTLLLLTALGRLPLFGFPLTSDEGGFLYVAGQWRAGGSSLYGDHWVDRPPVLIAFYAGADALGGATALRLMGAGLALVSVVLAHQIGRRLGGPFAAGVAATLTAAAMSSPLFGAWQVDGELIAVPLVLGGVLLVLGPTARAWCAAGALGAAAVLVKQNFADVLVLATALLAAELVMRRSPWREVMRRGVALLAGALAMLAVVLVLAHLRGTSPSGLWDAVVTFRADASRVIASSASSATPWRLGRFLLVVLATGAGLVVGLVVVRAFLRPRTPWLIAAAAMTTWEVIGIFAGGSYWLHYMLGLVPALVVGGSLLAGDAPARLGRPLRWGLGLAVASAVVANVWVLTVPWPDEPREVDVGRWLATSADPDDTAVVLFGAPEILYTAGLDSPYRELWSLPVRVRDPDLTDLTAVIEGPRPPTWLVVNGRGIATWGVDPRSANAAARDRYRLVGRMCGYTVFLRDGVVRDAAPAPDCGSLSTG